MRNDIYTHKGKRYKATRKDVAQKAILANENRHFFLVGDKASQTNFHANWFVASHPTTLAAIRKEREGMETDIAHCLSNLYNSACYYLDPELGKYPLYYLEII
jgi:hypothetical protein